MSGQLLPTRRGRLEPLVELVSITFPNTHLALERVLISTFSVDPSKSSSFDDILPGNFTILYSSGQSTTGDYFTDQFTIGGVTVDNFQVRHSNRKFCSVTSPELEHLLSGIVIRTFHKSSARDHISFLL